jgi:hypothetical protein
MGKRNRYNRYAKDEIARILKRYRESGLSMKAFAKRDGVPEKLWFKH